MDRDGIAARINRGLAKAGARLGTAWTVYRPADPMAPLRSPAFTLRGAVEIDVAMRREPRFGEGLRCWIGDAGSLRMGDILQGEGGTLFVVSAAALHPALLVLCNAVLGFSRWRAGNGYGGASEQAVAAGWPASVTLGGGGGAAAGGLPGEARAPGWRILCPSPPGATLAAGMLARDAGGRRYLLGGVETGTMGYRIDAVEARS